MTNHASERGTGVPPSRSINGGGSERQHDMHKSTNVGILGWRHPPAHTSASRHGLGSRHPRTGPRDTARNSTPALPHPRRTNRGRSPRDPPTPIPPPRNDARGGRRNPHPRAPRGLIDGAESAAGGTRPRGGAAVAEPGRRRAPGRVERRGRDGTRVEARRRGGDRR
ncbi:hypothetical protein PVAP13_8NG338700 [Panicum virgatum]|uniref:Uncharacterized protein n=1 Tax=Panicum virgatum TaxID=38727 RepID=A0A8T0PAJ1_PANVG|nr:hypothetical protein PVAP13_8NG338700 [Panicum virgatum]